MADVLANERLEALLFPGPDRDMHVLGGAIVTASAIQLGNTARGKKPGSIFEDAVEEFGDAYKAYVTTYGEPYEDYYDALGQRFGPLSPAFAVYLELQVDHKDQIMPYDLYLLTLQNFDRFIERIEPITSGALPRLSHRDLKVFDGVELVAHDPRHGAIYGNFERAFRKEYGNEFSEQFQADEVVFRQAAFGNPEYRIDRFLPDTNMYDKRGVVGGRCAVGRSYYDIIDLADHCLESGLELAGQLVKDV